MPVTDSSGPDGALEKAGLARAQKHLHLLSVLLSVLSSPWSIEMKGWPGDLSGGPEGLSGMQTRTIQRQLSPTGPSLVLCPPHVLQRFSLPGTSEHLLHTGAPLKQRQHVLSFSLGADKGRPSWETHPPNDCRAVQCLSVT